MLRHRFNEALKSAMKRRDRLATSTVRLILAAVKDRDIAARGAGKPGAGKHDGIGDDDILGVLQTMIRQRHDSIALYRQGGRPELAQREADEIAVIEGFMPRQLGAEETAAAVEEVMAEIGAASLKDLGRAMAALKARYAGRMDFATASALAKQRLGQK